jgi:hypothetical protein
VTGDQLVTGGQIRGGDDGVDLFQGHVQGPEPLDDLGGRDLVRAIAAVSRVRIDIGGHQKADATGRRLERSKTMTTALPPVVADYLAAVTDRHRRQLPAVPTAGVADDRSMTSARCRTIGHVKGKLPS